VVYNETCLCYVARQRDVTFFALGGVTSLTFFREDLRRVGADIGKSDHCKEARRRFLSASFFVQKSKNFARKSADGKYGGFSLQKSGTKQDARNRLAIRGSLSAAVSNCRVGRLGPSRQRRGFPRDRTQFKPLDVCGLVRFLAKIVPKRFR